MIKNNYKPNNNYRSKGEKRLADFFDQNGFKFDYESPTLVYDMNCKLRVWYPDFKVGRNRNLIVEYAGMQNNPDYDKGVAKKKKLYKANGLDALFLYPEDIYSKNWQDSLKNKLMRYQASRASGSARGNHYLNQKAPYQQRSQPLDSLLRSPTYQNSYR